jgi:Glycosyl transferases group 1
VAESTALSTDSTDGAGRLGRVKAPKIVAVASAADLDFRYGCTPAWWQLWKGMHEVGVDLIVTPYRGKAIESPWWRTSPNPLYTEAEAFAKARDFAARLKGDRYLRRAEESPEDSVADKAVREVIWRYVTPRWRKHLEQLLERERDVDAVVVFTVPMSHLKGIPTELRDRFGVPVVFYDGDVPMSLPEFGGMDTGFNYYHGADPSEYDLVISNSEGGLERLRELGARRAEAVFWGADPELFQPHDVEKDYDVFFYGYGDKFRREWMKALVGEPSRAAPDIDFALGGRDFRGDIGNAREIGDVPFNVFARAISAARINLNITRRSHATVFASSSSRPFELAAAGAAIVSNPYEGIERWFEPGRELLVVNNADEALAAYRELLADPSQAEELGRRARERALDEHTYAHRARRVLELVGIADRVPSRA